MRSFFPVTVILILVLLCSLSGCLQSSPGSTGHVQTSGQQQKPVPVSGPITIRKPGLYQLTGDLTPSVLNKSQPGSKALVCINILSSDVIFDGMGHVIDGKNIHPKCEWSSTYNAKVCEFSYGIYSSHTKDRPFQYSSIIIRNVTVTNWTTGFHFTGVYDIFLENSKSSENNCGLRVFYTSNITLRNNIIANNRGTGIEGSDNEKLTISGNIIANNQNNGVFLDGLIRTPVEISVPRPFQYIFGEQIILYPFTFVNKRLTSGGGHTFKWNLISDNRDGISLRSSDDNIIRYNTLRNNQGTGINLNKVDNTSVESNTIINSSYVGISRLNCGLNLVFTNNTFSGNHNDMQSYNWGEEVPLTIIIGTILVYLLKILAGTSKIVQKFESARIYKWIKIKFRLIEKRINKTIRYKRISAYFESLTFVSIFSAIVLGGVFTYSMSFGLKVDVFLALSILGGIVIVIPKAVQYIFARRMEIHAVYRLWWGGIFIMILTTILFRYVFGSPIHSEITNEELLNKKKIIVIKLIGPIVSVILGSIFFLFYLMKITYAPFAVLGLEMSLLFALVWLLPFSPMEGEEIYTWNKFVWAVFFFPVLIGYGYLLIIM
jgi:parallel beta-helix repeat protein